ncbi:MAG TPA: DUF2058 domain-containing protein [Desulfocapsa sulfexigens]|nr:DUF2058 domain-containing protein [Desulfocapsa sulfexigens]
MGNPFQDQLLKAGLVNKKQANKVKREKHLNRKQKKKDVSAEISDQARKEQAAQAERNRELNRLHAEEKVQRELKAQVKQLIEKNKLECDNFGDAYHFVEQGKIERIFVSTEMIEELSCGQLAIVKLNDTYEVVPAKVARQITCRAKEAVIVFHEKKKA